MRKNEGGGVRENRSGKQLKDLGLRQGLVWIQFFSHDLVCSELQLTDSVRRKTGVSQEKTQSWASLALTVLGCKVAVQTCPSEDKNMAKLGEAGSCGDLGTTAAHTSGLAYFPAGLVCSSEVICLPPCACDIGTDRAHTSFSILLPTVAGLELDEF